MNPETENIVLHNTPEFYIAYCKNWLQKIKDPVQRVIVEDFSTLIGIAAKNLKPMPAEESGK